MLFNKNCNWQQGLASVEFAIILPLIVLIALSVAELGRGLYQYNTLSKSVQDGVRYLSDKVVDDSGVLLDILIVDGDNLRTLEANTKNLVVFGDISGGGTPVIPGLALNNVSVTAIDVPMPGDTALPGGGISPNHVKVSATYNFSPLFPALSNLGYQLIPSITVSAVQRALSI